LKTYYLLEEELKFYSTALLRKKRLVVANKIDLLDPDPGNENRKNLEPLQDHCHKENLPYLEISAVKEINLNKFKNKLFELYHEV
jgi:GTPase involved in cell partitioning and DNA repair